MWQLFTEKARKSVFYAQEDAQKFGEGYVSTEHMLLGLIREDNLACRTLLAIGVMPKRVRAEVEKQLPRGDARPSQDMTLTPRAKRVIDIAYDEARILGNNYIGTEHLLLGLIREAEGLAGRVLAKLGVDLETARREVAAAQAKPDANSADSPTLRQTRPGIAFLKGRCLPHHLMLNFVADSESLCGRVIRAQCENFGKFQYSLFELVTIEARNSHCVPDLTAISGILRAAQEEAGEGETRPEHVLLALLRDHYFPDRLQANGITLERTRELIAELA